MIGGKGIELKTIPRRTVHANNISTNTCPATFVQNGDEQSYGSRSLQPIENEQAAEATLSLKGNLDDVGPVGSNNRDEFNQNFVEEMAKALGIDPSRIKVNGLRRA